MNYEKLFASLQKYITLSEAAIRERAYLLWEQNGCQPDVDCWLQAEQQLREEATANIIKQVISPNLQETVAKMQEETTNYIQKTTEMTTDMVRMALQRDQLVLPDGVRYHRRIPHPHANGYIDYLIVEEAPKVRTLLVDMGFHIGKINNINRINRHYGYSENHQRVRIALPYVIYGMRLGDSPILFNYFFRNKPLKSLGDTLCQSHLPNSDNSGKPCVPWEKFSAQMSLADKIKHSIQLFWSTEFNYSLSDTISSDERVQSFERWQQLTEENPLFALDVRWVSSQMSLESFIISDEKVLVSPAMQETSSKFSRLAVEILTLQIPKPKPTPIKQVQSPKTIASTMSATSNWNSSSCDCDDVY